MAARDLKQQLTMATMFPELVCSQKELLTGLSQNAILDHNFFLIVKICDSGLYEYKMLTV